MLVKRILALEGDIVKTLPPYPDQEIVVPQGHVWVEGLILPYILFFYKIIQEPYRRWTFLQRWQQSFRSGTISNSSILAHLFYWLFFFLQDPSSTSWFKVGYDYLASQSLWPNQSAGITTQQLRASKSSCYDSTRTRKSASFQGFDPILTQLDMSDKLPMGFYHI